MTMDTDEIEKAVEQRRVWLQGQLDAAAARFGVELAGEAVNTYDMRSAGATARDGYRDVWLRVVVEDQGVGIALDDMPQLFQRFFRAHDVYAHQRGLGLGLYITRGIVERHQGRIWAQSTFGEGSRFFVELPEAVPGQEAPA